MKNMNMKVLFLTLCLALVLAIPLGLAACAKESTPMTPATTSPATTAAPTKPAPTTPAATTPAPTKPAPTPTVPAATVFKWKFQSQYTSADFNALLCIEFCKMLERNSDGQIKIDTFYAPQLFPATESLENLQAGVIQLSQHASGYDIGKIPASGLPDSLLAFVEEADWVFCTNNLGLMDIMTRAYAPFGVIPLGRWASPKTILSRKPLTKLEDFKGLKLRAYGIPMEYFSELGAATTYIPIPEVYTSLATGMMDAVYLTHGAQVGGKVYEQTKYYLVPSCGLSVDAGAFKLSKAALDKLPNYMKTIIYLTDIEWSHWVYNFGMATDLYVGPIKTFEAAGLQASTFPIAEWEKSRPAWEKVVYAKAGKDTYALEFLDMLKKYYAHKADGTLWELVKEKYNK